MGSKVKVLKNKNSLIIKNDKIIKAEASYDLMSTMRAGIIVLGPLLSKIWKGKSSQLPGGCAI